uniref:Uncharacterized protein n=1 Tax=Wuchereria bancrofti TaxID=6293 RepID=A0AAF5Q5R7_WUCBA
MENINSLRTLSPMMTFHSLFRGLYLVGVFMFFAFRLKSSVGNAIHMEGSSTTNSIIRTDLTIVVQENCRKAVELKGNEAANHYYVCILMLFFNFENLICIFQTIFGTPAKRNA